MRRLLIRLVALQTTLVGFLAYWLFLVYANNPAVSQGLASQLGRFPQLSFTTVDISVLAIIVALSILIAYKLQRGLKPGIRLERALQMLESLMKRNLVLEAQVAELKPEKLQTIPPPAPPEPKIGSWERVFKTPIEAGPSILAPPGRGSSFGTSSSSQTSAGFARTSSLKPEPPETATLATSPTRDTPPKEPALTTIEKVPSRPPQLASSPLTATNSFVAQSPARTTGLSALKTEPIKTQPVPIPITISKQPYIPSPVPKGTIPPGVILGPGIEISRPPVPLRTSTKTPTDQSKPKPLQPRLTRPSTPLMPVGVTSPKTSAPLQSPSTVSSLEIRLEKELTKEAPTRQKVESLLGTKTETSPELKTDAKPEAKTDARTNSKQPSKTTPKPLKKFPYEEDE